MDITIRLRGQNVLFVHWPVDEATLRRHVPETLDIDTYDGSAWVSALIQNVAEVAPDVSPMSPLSSFPQVDFRTYVSHDGEPGVYFLTCDTGQSLNRLLGERAFHLPFTAADIDFDQRGDSFIIRSRRKAGDRPEARFDARYRPTGPASPAASGSLSEFLVERHRYYTPAEGPVLDPRGDAGLIAGDVERDPWQLAPVEADIRTNTLLSAIGLSATGDPVMEYCPAFESRFVGTERLAPVG